MGTTAWIKLWERSQAANNRALFAACDRSHNLCIKASAGACEHKDVIKAVSSTRRCLQVRAIPPTAAQQQAEAPRRRHRGNLNGYDG